MISIASTSKILLSPSDNNAFGVWRPIPLTLTLPLQQLLSISTVVLYGPLPSLILDPEYISFGASFLSRRTSTSLYVHTEELQPQYLFYHF
jgi:hypothetical protein